MNFRNLNLVSIVLLSGALFFTSCDKEEGPAKDVLSELPTEEHKKNIEDEGIAFVNNMDQMANMKTYDIYEKLDEMLSNESVSAYSLNRILTKANSPLKSANEEVTGLKAEFAAEAGIYTWDELNSTWKKTAESTDRIEYHFDVENKEVVFSVWNFDTVKNIDFDQELPTSINASLVWGTETLCTFEFVAEYDSNFLPNYLRETLTLEGYIAESVIDLKDKTAIKTNNKLEYNGQNLLAFGMTLNGNFDMEDIASEMAEIEEKGVGSQDILTKANAYVQLGNLKGDVFVDTKGLIKYYASFEGTGEDEIADPEKLNEYIKLALRYADSNEVFAYGEFFIDTFEDTYYNGYEDVTETYQDINVKFNFVDGSAITSDVFGKVIDEMNEMILTLNTNYGLELEVIEE